MHFLDQGIIHYETHHWFNKTTKMTKMGMSTINIYILWILETQREVQGHLKEIQWYVFDYFSF